MSRIENGVRWLETPREIIEGLRDEISIAEMGGMGHFGVEDLEILELSDGLSMMMIKHGGKTFIVEVREVKV